MSTQKIARSLGFTSLGLWLLLQGAAQAANLQVSVQDPEGKPLEDAVVYLDSPEAAQRVQPMPGAEIIQRNKSFIPEVTVITKGTPVSFPNQDTVRHHVYSFSPIKKFDIKLYAGTPESPVIFDRAGVAVLGCNIHDQMAAWVVVLETPYMARTNEQGNAVLEGVMPGDYRLRVWHSRLRHEAAPLDRPLSISGDKMTSVRFSEF